MTFVTILSDALQSLATQLEAIRKMAEERAARLAASPRRIYQLKEALSFLGISNIELKRARYNGRIQYHQADDKFWFYQSELIDFQTKYLSISHG